MCIICRILSSVPYLLLCVSLLHLPGLALAQSEPVDSTGTGKPETSMELVFTESNNTSKLLTVTVKTKIGEDYTAVSGISVNFYKTEPLPENLLGTAASNDLGVAHFLVPADKLSKNALDYTFIAAIENDAKLEDNQEEISVKEADFVMNLKQQSHIFL